MNAFLDWLNRKPAGPKPKKPIARNVRPKLTSDKRRLEGAIYRKRRTEFLAEHPFCQAVIPRTDHCEMRACDVHHTAGRYGGNYLDRTTWLAVCRPCHDWIHAHPAEARKAGLLK